MKNYLAYLHYIWFSHKNLFKIFDKDKEYKNFYENFTANDLRIYWIQYEKSLKIIENRNSLSLQKIDNIISSWKIELVCYHDENYPVNLKNIPNKPFLIYVKWNLKTDLIFISIVWSRKWTKYSEVILEKIIPDLINNWFWIVSWWAYWVDSLSHKLAILNNWYTISVIWTWIDRIYPASNRQLYENIIDSWWAVLSIFPIWTLWDNFNFPIRNEIIAWISSWTLVTEAWDKSWTLITANLALELNKEVFIIPWDITRETSIWSNKLIQNWLWKLVMNSEDILDEYNIYKNSIQKREIVFSDNIEEEIYNLIKNDIKNSSEISQILEIDIITINFKLSMMEINGMISLNIWWEYEIC